MTSNSTKRRISNAKIPGRFGISINIPDLKPPEGWSWHLLTDLAEMKTGHTPSRKHPEYWEDGDIPWMASADATKHHGGYIFDTAEKTNELGIANSAAVILPKDTVCLSRTASIGYVVITGEERMATSQNFVNWVCGPDLNPQFLRLMLMAEFDSVNMFSYGSVHSSIYYDELLAFTICCPPRKQQDKIVNQLLTIEEYGWNCQKIDKLSYELIFSLFRSWFIDFDPVKAKAKGKLPYGMDEETAALFPDSLEDSELGLIPTGWKVGKLSDIAETKMGQSPPGDSYCNPSEGLPMVNGAADFSKTEIKAKQGTKKPLKICEKGDFIYCIRATVGNLRIADQQYCIGRGAAFSREKNVNDKWFVYQTIQELFLIWRWEATGSVMINVTSTQIRDSIVLIPPELLREKFGKVVHYLFEQEEKSIKSQITLTKTRDALLPRLMSGELKLN